MVGVLMARNTKSVAEVHVLTWAPSAWAWLVAAILIAGCSVPVPRTPSFVDAPAYDSPRCEDARRLDAQAGAWWLPTSCFKAAAR
jgi:hypothetical protein